jgi:hypothetical protein
VALDTAEKHVQEYRVLLDTLEKQLSKSGTLLFTEFCSGLFFMNRVHLAVT